MNSTKNRSCSGPPSGIFAEKTIRPRCEELWEEGEFPYDIVKQMGELGYLGIPWSEEYGGVGGDYLTYSIAVEELARLDGAIAITVEAHTSLGSSNFYYFGTEEQKQKWLVPMAEGKMLGAFGLTEPEAGSDSGSTRTTAKLDNGEWVINGTKAFITNSGTDITWGVTVTAVTGVSDAARRRSPLSSCPTAPRATTSRPSTTR